MENTDEESGLSGLPRRSRRLFIQSAGVVGLGLTAGTSLATSDQTDEADDEHAETDTDESADAAPTEIDSCTVIDEAGEYELVADLAPENLDQPACVMIESDGVTLHGNGHTVDLSRVEPRDYDGIAFNHGERHETNRDHWETTIRNVDVRGARYGVSTWATLDTHLDGVTALENGTGFYMFAAGGTVENSVASHNERGIFVTGDSRGLHGSALEMERSTVWANGGVGISVDIDSSVTATTSRLVTNQIGISTTEHSSARLEDCHICRNERYGAHSSGDPGDESSDIPPAETTLRAMNCYWGASNGPSSFGDPEEPYTDPETGEPADGDGDAVSQSLKPGVSNVRFDPFHEATLDGVGADR